MFAADSLLENCQALGVCQFGVGFAAFGQRPEGLCGAVAFGEAFGHLLNFCPGFAGQSDDALQTGNNRKAAGRSGQCSGKCRDSLGTKCGLDNFAEPAKGVLSLSPLPCRVG